MRPSPPWRSPEAFTVAALLTLAGAVGTARPAAAQACCTGGALVTPTRLAAHEDLGVGLQLRARSNGGSFDSAGEYRAFGGAEQVLEQDLAASFRFSNSGQVGAVLPIVETHRTAGGLDDSGGGAGDLALTMRYDLLLPSEALYLPGFGALAAVTIPTGTAANQATHHLAADATGAGTYDVTIGADVEKSSGHAYAAINAWLTYRFPRRVTIPGAPTIRETFGARVSLLAIAGYAFDNEAGLGVYVSAMNEGNASINGVEEPSTRLRLTTLGLAGVLPVRDRWRIQGALFSDLRLSGLGRNEPAGAGVSAALVRVWL
jgi:hypothetical protein